MNIINAISISLCRCISRMDRKYRECVLCSCRLTSSLLTPFVLYRTRRSILLLLLLRPLSLDEQLRKYRFVVETNGACRQRCFGGGRERPLLYDNHFALQPVSHVTSFTSLFCFRLVPVISVCILFLPQSCMSESSTGIDSHTRALFRTLYPVSRIHMDRSCLCTPRLWPQLLSL